MHKSLYFDFFFVHRCFEYIGPVELILWNSKLSHRLKQSESQLTAHLPRITWRHLRNTLQFYLFIKKIIINKEERVWERKLKITFTFRFTCIIYSSFHTTIPNPKKLKRKKQQNFSQSGQTKEEAVTEYIVWFVTLLLFCFAPIQFIFNSIQFIFQMVSCTYFTFFLCIIFNHSLTIKLLSLLLVILVLPQIKISFKSSQNR